ncbi:MAG: hypothetical protein KF800_07460 [Lysobacter sp.]|nr:hypothetical protein [Lysobacter sp.]
MSSFSTLLFTLSAYLPDLIGLGIALIMLLGSARPGRERRNALVGIAIMAISILARLGLTFYQNAIFASGAATSDVAGMMNLFMSVHTVLNLITIAGFLMVVWALCRATRAADAR